MKVRYSGRVYQFRECDTVGVTQEQLQEQVNKTGHLQYEPSAVWLVVSGIGYGWEVPDTDSMTIYDIRDEYTARYPEGKFFDEEMLKRYGESIGRMRVTGKGVIHSRGFGDVIGWEVIAQRETILGLEEARYYFDAETFELIESA